MVKLKAFEFEGFPGTSMAGTVHCQPASAFKNLGLLVWNARGNLKSLKIAGTEQLIPPGCPLGAFESPLSKESVRHLIETGGLELILPSHLKGLLFATAPAGQLIEVGIVGSFDHLILWGVEYIDEN